MYMYKMLLIYVFIIYHLRYLQIRVTMLVFPYVTP